MQSPVKKIYITQIFGVNKANYAKFGLEGHNGIDFRAFLPNGERCYEGGRSEVFAPHDGEVKECAFDPSFGNYVKIEDGKQGSVLAHFSSLPILKLGQKIKMGDFIGFQGTTGNSSGIHLHWGWYPIPRNRQNGFNGYENQEGKYKPYSATPPESTMSDLQSVLDYYRVKTKDELIKMVDEQLKFLGDERKKNATLQGEKADLSAKVSEYATKITFLEGEVEKLSQNQNSGSQASSEYDKATKILGEMQPNGAKQTIKNENGDQIEISYKLKE